MKAWQGKSEMTLNLFFILCWRQIFIHNWEIAMKRSLFQFLSIVLLAAVAGCASFAELQEQTTKGIVETSCETPSLALAYPGTEVYRDQAQVATLIFLHTQSVSIDGVMIRSRHDMNYNPTLRIAKQPEKKGWLVTYHCLAVDLPPGTHHIELSACDDYPGGPIPAIRTPLGGGFSVGIGIAAAKCTSAGDREFKAGEISLVERTDSGKDIAKFNMPISILPGLINYRKIAEFK
jgi:hypothetical protein